MTIQSIIFKNAGEYSETEYDCDHSVGADISKTIQHYYCESQSIKR
ncbi:Uncharacterised protein [Staphylococcus muscae]|uniref:Uncharacterized protein n=1 Tax=Staphylococcus muscae TaxID=1294 RepID=A0A240BW95_9STAP|nr:hypothetical protein GCM10007183_06010 [Staphylococcus muscae]SNV99945.1 Uncharacterised protein [Staphylococcus muscae]